MSEAPGAPLSGRDRILAAARKHEQSKAPQLPPAPVEPDFSDAEYLAVLPAGVIPQADTIQRFSSAENLIVDGKGRCYLFSWASMQIMYDPRCKVPRKSRQLTLQKLFAGHLRAWVIFESKRQTTAMSTDMHIQLTTARRRLVADHLRVEGVGRCRAQRMQHLAAPSVWKACLQNASSQESALLTRASTRAVYVNAAARIKAADWQQSGPTSAAAATEVSDSGALPTGGADSAGSGQHQPSKGTGTVSDAFTEGSDDMKSGTDMAVGHGASVSTAEDVQPGGEGNIASQAAAEKSNDSRQPGVRDAAKVARRPGDNPSEVAKPVTSPVMRRVNSADRSGKGSAVSTMKQAVTHEPPEADACHDAASKGGVAQSRTRSDSQSSESETAERIIQHTAAFVPPSIQQLQDIVLSAASLSGGDRIHLNSRPSAAHVNGGNPKRGLLSGDQGVPDSRQQKAQRTDAGPL